jgi:hypothetical protein
MTGCAKDNVLFVTTTTIGIDADSRPPHATIGYDRYEGYIGPAYGTGAIPPVFAKIESDLAIFQPKIRQLYATGEAARLVTQQETPEPPQPDADMFADTSNVMLFGTGANIGLRVTFAGNVPESLSLGYKRKEFSFIPLGTTDHPTALDPKDPSKKRQVHTYGSVLAAMDMNVHTESFSTAGLGVTQFFATGDAAKNLAARDSIRQRFALEAEESIRSVACKAAPDTATVTLESAMEANQEFRGQLQDWLNSEGIDISAQSFVDCDIYAEERKRAIAALLPS